MCFSAPQDPSNKRALTSRESKEERSVRIQKAETRKIRKLSGWNVFQRENMEGLVLTREGYQQKVKELSQKWRAMSVEDKGRFQIDANYRQNRLDQLAQTPLPSKTAGACDQENVWRNAAKKLSCRRLALNVKDFQSSSLWDLPTQLGDSFFIAY